MRIGNGKINSPPYWLVLCAALLAAASLVDDARAQEGRFAGSFLWQHDDPRFGGFSGFEISQDGTRFVTVSDGGVVASGSFLRDERGRIVGVSDLELHPLLFPDGHPVHSYLDDAEGLAMLDDDTILVSFEGEHRIWRYTELGGPAEEVQAHPDFAGLQNNSALETLAIAPDGSLIAIPERSGLLSRPFPVYRLMNGTWDTPWFIERKPPYLVVGGDFGPDGRFYLLERHLNGFLGFQSRVRRFDWSPETGFSNPIALVETTSAVHDNLEGIAVWKDAEDRIRLTMISDDNYRPFQRTEIVEYFVEE